MSPLSHFGRLAASGLLSVLGASAVSAQMDRAGQSGTPAQMEMGRMQGGSPPPDARDPHAYSGGVDFTRGGDRPRLADHMRFGRLLVDNLEVLRAEGETTVPYDIEGWFGDAYERAVLKSEGDIESGEIAGSRTELLWGHAIAAYWDTQLGVRHDTGPGPDRTWLAAGIEGLAPYRFDVEVTGYIGEGSRTALRADASYDMLITQRLILQPRIELNVHGRDDPARGLGSGLSDATLALRLRYELRRELAPYVSLVWVDQYGGTEDLTRLAGNDPSDIQFLIGMRFWF